MFTIASITDLPGYLPPLATLLDTQDISGLPIGNDIYAYTSSVSLVSGYSLFRLSGFTQEVCFDNIWNIVITLALPISASIAKYAILTHGATTFPSDFTVRFFDVNNLQVGIDIRSTEVFATRETKEFIVASTGVTKATLMINRIA